MTARRELPLHMRLAPFSVGEAAASGISRNRLRAADVSAPFRGVRAPAGPLTLHDRCSAFRTLMAENQAFCGATAAQLWGLPVPAKITRDSRLHVLTWGTDWASTARGVLGHRSAQRPNIVMLHGLRLTDATSSWCALAAGRGGHELSLDELVEAGDRLLGRPAALCGFDEIDAAIAGYGTRRGVRALREARALLRAGSESPRETRLRLVVLRAGLPEPEPNGVITLGDGRSTHGDLVFRRYRVLLEYDGEHHLTDPVQWARDVARLNDLADAGWLVIRVTKTMQRGEILARTERALRQRGWTP